MKKAAFHILGILLILLQGCEKEYTWYFHSEDTPRIVVDAIITNERKQQEIFLSLAHDQLNDSAQPLLGAEVNVSDGFDTWNFQESDRMPGLYLSDTFIAVINYTYQLEIIYQSDTITAEAGVSSVVPLSDYEIIHDSVTQLNRFEFNDWGKASMTEVFYDWSADSVFSKEYGSTMAQETFYAISSRDVNEMFPPDKQRIYFPSGTRLQRKKYSLTEEHEAYIRSLLMESEWSGGIFDVQHGNLLTNLSNGAVGYFAACMVVMDSLEVQ